MSTSISMGFYIRNEEEYKIWAEQLQTKFLKWGDSAIIWVSNTKPKVRELKDDVIDEDDFVLI